MLVSRQFRALARIAALFSGSWAAVGAVIGALGAPSLTGETALVGATSFALMYGTAGGIAGVATALLVARAEVGRQVSDIPTWRLAAWGVIGGVVPVALFGVLGLVAGASLSAVLPLLGVGVIGGGISGTIAGSASAAAKRAQLTAGNESPRFPAT